MRAMMRIGNTVNEEKKLDVSSATIDAVAVHRIGNKLREEGYLLSSKEIELTEKLKELFLRHYLLPILNTGERCVFDHPSDISLNEVRHFAAAISTSKTSFIEGTKSIAKHLYDASAHPNIGGGEFIVIQFKGIILSDHVVDGLGLFRIEAKDDFLDVRERSGDLQLIDRKGISISTIQKGALVIPKTDQVLAIDTLGQKTRYWKETFLQVKMENNSLARAKAAGALIKAVSERLQVPSEASQFVNVLQDEMADLETTTISDICKISTRFLPQTAMNEVVRGIESRTGLTLDDTASIQTQQLSKFTRDVIRKSKIADGVAIIISKADTRVSSIDIKKTSTGIRAVVELQVREGK